MKECGEPCKHRACLHGKERAEARGQGLQPVSISRNSWSRLIDCAALCGGDGISIWEACCVYYDLCAPSVITSFSLMLWNLWRRLDGTKGCSYEEYWNLPAIYVDACDIIESEIVTMQNRQQREVLTKDL